MGIFSSLKNRIARSNLAKLKSRKGIQHAFVNWDKISHVGLVCNASAFRSQREVESIVEAFNRNGKNVEVMVFSPFSLKKWSWIPSGIPFISKENLTWSGIPKPETVVSFLKPEYDAIFVIDFDNTFLSEWFGTLSKAKVVVAPLHENNQWATFMIEAPKNDIKTFIEQSVRYLKVINPNQ